MQKSGRILSITIQNLRCSTIYNYSNLIDAIGTVVGRNLSKSCSVASIVHSFEYKILISNKTSSVKLKDKEIPGNTLRKTDEPTELHRFSYERLKQSAQFTQGKYRGKLYGTIQLCECDKTITCPSCTGAGKCAKCDGEKQITCPVCEGEKECVSCNGTGIYTCTNCDGDGECPECNEGWCTCGNCDGDGTMSCPDCDGTGIYQDTCNRCNGTGYYDWNNHVVCRVCGGSGIYKAVCHCCDGDGTVDCYNCDGDGGWTCADCHGTGKCSHCHGDGGFTCKACGGSGACGKCKGKGNIWCPDCHGKGVCFDCKGETFVKCPRCNGLGEYQSYTEYSLTDKKSKRELCSLPINENDIRDISGDSIYNDVIYDFFAGRANVYDDKTILNQVSADDKENLVKKWIALEKNSPFTKGKIGNDYLHTIAELTKIPVTKVVFKCNNKHYNVWIVGNNKIVFYDDLPGLGARFIGRLEKLFSGQ